jgi:glycerophosphoryl diester phosphodiesterase
VSEPGRAPSDEPTSHQPGRLPFVWAHRGASALAPENSLRAFLLAVELGARGVELDVQLSADGVPVVIHDPALWRDGASLRLHRPPGGSATRLGIADCRWSDLAGVPIVHPDGSTEPLARLEEVFAALPDTLWIDVEAKAGACYDPRLADVLVGCIRQRPDRVLVSSFDHVVLREVAQRRPELPLSALCDARLVDARPVLAAIPAPMICMNRAFVTASDVERFGAQGIAVSVYGQQILYDLEDLLTWPVAGIFLDDPRLATAAAPRPRPGAAPAQ